MPSRDRQFARRVLAVTSDKKYLGQLTKVFREQGYEVRSASDGFDALMVLRGALPDLLICELNLPRMSGFELLSVVRTRFPQIGVIAVSAEYTSATLPDGTIADAFVHSGADTRFELLMTARDLIGASPLRSTKAKSEFAPVWIPRSSTGYIITTCPECLRSTSVAQPRARASGPVQETCVACGATFSYQLEACAGNIAGETAQLPTARARDLSERSKAAVSTAQEAISDTQAVMNRHKPDHWEHKHG